MNYPQWKRAFLHPAIGRACLAALLSCVLFFLITTVTMALQGRAVLTAWAAALTVWAYREFLDCWQRIREVEELARKHRKP